MAVTQIRGDSQLQNNTLTNDSLKNRTTDLTISTVVTDTNILLQPNGAGIVHASKDVTVDTKVNTDIVSGRTGDLELRPFTDSATGISLQNSSGINYVTLGTANPGAQVFFAGNGSGDTQLTMDSTNGGTLIFSDASQSTQYGQISSDTSGVLDLQSHSGSVGVLIQTAGTGFTWAFDPNGKLTTPGQIDMSTFSIIDMANPVNPQDAATKFYVDSIANGLSWKNAVQAATATTLARYAYSNGSSGVGATLTATANAALVVDGYTVSTNDRILVKNETTGTTTQTSVVTGSSFTVASTTGIYVGTVLTDTTTSHTTTVTVVNTGTSTVTVASATGFNNGDSLTWDDQPFNGIYTVTQTGDGSHPYILTRSLDQNTPAEFPAAAVFSQQGTANSDTGFVCTSKPTVVIGTTDITWVQFSTTGTVTAGNGIDVSGTTVSISTDNSLTANSPNSTPSLQVKLDPARAITVVTAGIGVNVDNSTIDISANAIEVKTGGITNTQVSATAAIAFSKLASLTSAHILLGNGSNVATDTAVTGDVHISNTGVTTIQSGAVTFADTTLVVREVPSGTIDGSNRVFTTANNFVSGSEHLYLNGILQSSVASTDYTVTGANQITFNVGNAPLTGSTLLITYWKS